MNRTNVVPLRFTGPDRARLRTKLELDEMLRQTQQLDEAIQRANEELLARDSQKRSA